MRVSREIDDSYGLYVDMVCRLKLAVTSSDAEVSVRILVNKEIVRRERALNHQARPWRLYLRLLDERLDILVVGRLDTSIEQENLPSQHQ